MIDSTNPPPPERRESETPAPPTTTKEQDRVTHGQRNVNLLWEVTQSLIALGMTIGVVVCVRYKIESTQLWNAFFIIITFYFSRTNHTKTGGIGYNPSKER